MTGPGRPSGRLFGPAPTPPPPPTRRPIRWRVWLLALAAAGIALLIVAPWVPRTVPDEILGVWLTSDSTYADRALELQPHALLFRGGGTAAQTVRRVRRVVQGALIRYEIEYEADGGPVTLKLTYAPGSGVIKLASRPTVFWHRVRR